VDVGRLEPVVVVVLVGTFATDLVPKRVRQLIVGVWAKPEVTRSGKTARTWMMLFIVEEKGEVDEEEDDDAED
jgi:hypothetical protein